MESLFEAVQKYKKDKWQFEAAIHGIDIDIDSKESSESFVSPKQSDPDMPLFGDPEEYESMSSEEREVKTKNMMTKHRTWAGRSFKKG